MIKTKHVKFLDLHIGELFLAHNVVWVRTSYEGARCLNPDRGGTVCNFTIDDCDKVVRKVDAEEVCHFILN